MRDRVAWTLAASLVLVASFAACGARTELDGLDGFDGEGGSGTSPGAGAGGGGANGRRDAGHDATDDVVHTDDCTKLGRTSIYLITLQNELIRFDPRNVTFDSIGFIGCGGDFALSIAVDRRGTGWVQFQNSGAVDQVSTTNAHCTSIDFKANQDGFHDFGMAYATDAGGPAETLFVAESSHRHPSKGLGKIDTDTKTLEFIAPFSEDLGDTVALTGTGDGRLFGFFLATPGPGSSLAEIDKTNGRISDVKSFSFGVPSSSIAVAFYQGSFYLFTDDGHGGGTVVTQYDPATNAETMITTLGTTVVGGGSPTCAPE